MINVGDRVWMGIDDSVGLEGVVISKLKSATGVDLCIMRVHDCPSIIGPITVEENSLDKVK